MAICPITAIYRNRGHPDGDWIFNDALGELWAIIGLHVGQLSSAYGIDIEHDLANILPAETGPDDQTTDDDGLDSRLSRWD